MTIVNYKTPGVNPNIFATTQVTANGTAALALASRDLRDRVHIKNTSSTAGQIIYIGLTNAVTTTTGFPIDPGDSIELHVTSNIYVITGGASITTAILEEYITTG